MTSAILTAPTGPATSLGGARGVSALAAVLVATVAVAALPLFGGPSDRPAPSPVGAQSSGARTAFAGRVVTPTSPIIAGDLAPVFDPERATSREDNRPADAPPLPARLLSLPRATGLASFVPPNGSGTDGSEPGRRFVARFPGPAATVMAAVAAVDGADRGEAASRPPVPAATVETRPVALASLEPFLPPEAANAAPVPIPRARPALRRIASAPADALEPVRPAPTVLAYARPDAGLGDVTPERRGILPMPQAGKGVAVYDIEAATVYLPNGERLEAHSGLGKMRDDPSFVHKKNRGPTPPHTYDLSLRESLFHGVQAIRLTPIGGKDEIHNRDGILAHTYMLGPRGDSNGCVSFKNYKRFLAAFRRGEVKRLVVVPRGANPASRFAWLFGSKK